MSTKFFHCSLLVAFYASVIFSAVVNITHTSFAQSFQKWKIHDHSRPLPPIVDPGIASTQEKTGQPPSDAIVLFDGKNLFQWRSMDGSPPKWRIKDDYVETVRGAGYIRTVQNFGDCQLHIEWAAPVSAKGKGQGRGNSGVFLMGKYEVQVLDSYENKTYADGQAAAIYGQYPPVVNACRPPGQWQTYDIIFHRPHFDDNGKLVRKATMTVLHNGVLVQDNVEVLGPTTWMRRLPYKAHPDKLPLSLQDHGNPVRYRNIWIRELVKPTETPRVTEKEITLSQKILNSYEGQYQTDRNNIIEVKKDGNQLLAQLGRGFPMDYIYALSQTRFFSKEVDAYVVFSVNEKGVAESLTIELGEGKTVYKKVK